MKLTFDDTVKDPTITVVLQIPESSNMVVSKVVLKNLGELESAILKIKDKFVKLVEDW